MGERWLLADLGGTNTRVGLAEDGVFFPETAKPYRNAEFSGLAPLLTAYLSATNPGPVTALCAGVAGPVRNGTVQLTNHSWFIDCTDLQEATGATTTHLMNDLQAQGYALDDIPNESITTLFPGATAGPQATRLVYGLGTGCNVAVVHQITQGLLVPPAESGHSTLPHATGQLGELLDYLARDHHHLPLECAISGPGLSNIHHWLTGTRLPAPAITSAAVDGDARATETLRMFCQLFGAVTGNLALAHLPMGGIYLIGSTARAVAPFLSGMGFLDHFTAKGPYTEIMQDIPILLIKDDMAALRGCVRCLQQMLK